MMTTTKVMNERLLSLMAENRAQVELIQDVEQRAKNDEELDSDSLKHMQDLWNVETWLIAEVIQPALEEALINQELRNW